MTSWAKKRKAGKLHKPDLVPKRRAGLRFLTLGTNMAVIIAAGFGAGFFLNKWSIAGNWVILAGSVAGIFLAHLYLAKEVFDEYRRR